MNGDTADPTVTAERLAALAAAEENAVESRNWELLLTIQEEQQELLAALPSSMPSEAKGLLELALQRSGATQRALFACLAETKGTIERLGTGRRTIGAYGMRAPSGIETRA